MTHGIDKDEWYPVYVPTFVDCALYSGYAFEADFTDEEVYIIKNAFLLFNSAQDILEEKYNDTRSNNTSAP